MDWASARGVADEAHIDRFVQSVGGERLDQRFPNASFQNADYIFPSHKVIVELKVLETEFGAEAPFMEKEEALRKEMAQTFSLGEILRGEPGPAEYYSRGKLELYRAPLARIAKKANRQLRETRAALADDSYRGVLWLVNDGLRAVGVELVLSVLYRILNGANSEIRALVYVTNHYVDVPGSDLANLLWVPAYADADADDLPDFINWLGSQWSIFVEAETGPFDGNVKGPDISIAGARPIR